LKPIFKDDNDCPFFRFDDSATPPQVTINEDLAVGETVVNVKAIPGQFLLKISFDLASILSLFVFALRTVRILLID
jgi:hypothetical protein